MRKLGQPLDLDKRVPNGARVIVWVKMIFWNLEGSVSDSLRNRKCRVVQGKVPLKQRKV